MSPIAPALAALGAEVADLTARFGRRVDPAVLGVLDRRGQLALRAPGRVSANGACGLFAAADGWIAVNLARDDDRDLVPAWLGCDYGVEPWAAVATLAPGRSAAELVESAAVLGLPVAAVGEATPGDLAPRRRRLAAGRARRSGGLTVIDLSALWAGPLCGALLAAMGAQVTRVDSLRRPDPTRGSTPDFFARLNAAKAVVALDLATPEGQARLFDEVAAADVLITSARARAFASVGLAPEAVFSANPGLVWVAVTGHGVEGAGAGRVAFGDDAAAAGGLVRWTRRGEPRFLGDALADPLTGLAATTGALCALGEGGGVMVDAAMARAAAGAAALCGLARAA